jgi:hypothetical protein
MSIIIVCVGCENFAAMETLDSDKGLLKSGNAVASRDIVQVTNSHHRVEIVETLWLN